MRPSVVSTPLSVPTRWCLAASGKYDDPDWSSLSTANLSLTTDNGLLTMDNGQGAKRG